MRSLGLRAALLAAIASISLVATASLAHADAATATVVVSLDPSQGQLPESITTDSQGNLYFSGATNQIWKVVPDGKHQPVLFATLPLPHVALPAYCAAVGLKIGPDGYLYALSASSSPSADASRAWRISPTGDVREYAHLDPNGQPNDLAFDNLGNLYVTDLKLGRIVEIGPGGEAAGATPTVWLSNPLLAPNPANPGSSKISAGSNGIAFDAGKKNLYVDNYDNGQIVEVSLDRNGQPGNVSIFASDPRLKGGDGIAFDASGTLYVAVNTQNQITTVSRTGTVNVLASGPIFDSPSSLVFSSQDGDSQGDTLYIANFAIQELINGLTPHPALLQMPVQVGGLPLP